MNTPNKLKLNLNIDLKWITVGLLVIIAVMFALWRPWQSDFDSSSRTISVTGETTLKAEPDEYVFYPSYQFVNSDKAAAIAEAQAKSDEVVNKLKSLGVADKQIKTDLNGYVDNYKYSMPTPVNDGDGDYNYTLSVTITVNNRAEAQKIQDYLNTTSPIGSVTPSPSFSQSLRKSLESKARDQATKDARSKAEQSARNLGFKIAGVKSVSDETYNNGIYPMALNKDGSTSTSMMDASTSLSVQPGEQELPYSVTVVYFVK